MNYGTICKINQQEKWIAVYYKRIIIIDNCYSEKTQYIIRQLFLKTITSAEASILALPILAQGLVAMTIKLKRVLFKK